MVKATNIPTTYGALANLSCNGATSFYDEKYQRVEISQINTRNVSCSLNYTNRTNKAYLNNYIIGLSGTSQGIGKLVHETFDQEINNSTFTNATKQEKTDYISFKDDETYPWTWNSINKTWASSNKGSSASSTTSEFSFNVKTNGDYQICYKQSSEMNFDFGTIYKNGTSILSLKGRSITSNYECTYLGKLTTTDTIKFTYEKDSSGNSGSDQVEFYIESGTYKEIITTENVDTGYRYEGQDPNNYVWFNNELWRIIGVFGENTHGQTGQNLVKITRDKTLDPLVWNENLSNDWKTSTLKSLLNDYYLNQQDGTGSAGCYKYDYNNVRVRTICDYRIIGINEKYRSMIKNVTWHLGGRSSTSATASVFYNAERGTEVYSGRPTIDTGYLGLMYPSDFGYSVLSSSCSRKTELSAYNTLQCGGQSWIYDHVSEWLITHNYSGSYHAFNLSNYLGNLGSASDEAGHNIRPTLYLNSYVYKINGDGTKQNPYIIGMDGE